MIHIDKIETKLPAPHSHLSQTSTLAANEDGDLVRSMCLLGGCRSPLTTSMTALQDGREVAQYTCSDVSDANFIIAPGTEEESDADAMEDRQPMPRARYRHSSVAINGQIWVVGGRDENDNIIHAIDIFDEIHDKWFTLGEGLGNIILPNSMNYGVSDHCAFGYGQDLFLVGGFDKNYNSVGYTIAIETVKSFEENRLVYVMRAPLNAPRGACGVAAIGDHEMVIAGGFTSDDGFCEAMKSTEVYYPRKNSWELMLNSPLKYGRARPNLAYMDHELYAFGGERRGIFDPETGRCDEDYLGNDSKVNDLESNRLLPNRLSYPVDGVEILDVEDVHDIHDKRWRFLQVSE